MKRMISLLMAAALVLSLAPAGVYATENPADPEASACICESKCTEGSVKTDCPVCGVEGADFAACCQGTASQPKSTPSIAFSTGYNPNKIYDGQPLDNPTPDQLIITGAEYEDVEFRWFRLEDGGSVDVGNAEDAGTYYVLASLGKDEAAVSAQSGIITITPAKISIASATVLDKSYDGTTSAEVESVVFTGGSPVKGTDYTAEAFFDTDDVGENKTATVTVTLTTHNYTFAGDQDTAAADTTAAIEKRPVALSWSDTSFTYDGSEHSFTAAITNVVGGEDVSLEYDSSSTTAATDAGTYTAIVSGLTGNEAGNYTLEGVENTTLTWHIAAASITGASVTLSPDTATYNGTEQEPTVTVTLKDGTTLTANDYTVTYKNSAGQTVNAPKDAGNYIVTVACKGNYTGTITIPGFTISPAEIRITGATLAPKTYDGTTAATVESVTFDGLVNGESLTSDDDYTATATFADPKAGDSKQATVTVTLKNGNYTFGSNSNTVTATGTISPLPVELEWSTPTSFTYDGSEHSFTAAITNVVGGEDVSLEYDSSSTTAATDAGTYTAIVSGLTGNEAGNYTLEGVENTTLTWHIAAASITGAEVLLSQSSFTYDGSEHKPTVTVTLNGQALVEGRDYTLTGTLFAKDAGTYTLTVTGKGNYTGTVSKDYTIAPAPLTITGVDVQSKTYDGTTAATVTGVSFKGLVNGEALAMGTDYTALADFADASVGTGKSVTGKVTLLSSVAGRNYTLTTAGFNATADIAAAPSKLDFKADRTKPIKGQVVTFSVTPQLKGDNRSFLQRLLGIGTPTVEFWVGNTKLGEVKVEEGKTSTFAYDTDKGGLKLGKNTVTAKFTGSGNLQGCEESLVIYLHDSTTSAPTGDTSNIQLWTAALVVSALALIGLGVGTVLYRKKRK